MRSSLVRSFSGRSRAARRAGVVLVAMATVLGISQLPALAATPNAPTAMAFQDGTSPSPVLAATVSDSGGGTVTATFRAQTSGASTWNITTGTSVSVPSGSVAL